MDKIVIKGSVFMKIDSSRKEQIKAMKDSGMTHQQIADELGITRQRISQILKTSPTIPRGAPANQCIYKGLREWLIENDRTFTEMNEIIGSKEKGYQSFSRKARGIQEFKISEIKKILDVTGMTFEECFNEE